MARAGKVKQAGGPVEKGLRGQTVHATYLKKTKRDGTSYGSSDEPNPCPISDDLYPDLKGELGEE